MVALASCPPDTTTKLARRRALLVERHRVLRSCGTCHTSEPETREAVSRVVNVSRIRAHGRAGLMADPAMQPMDSGEDAGNNGAESSPADLPVSRFAMAEETRPQSPSRVFVEPILSPVERARLRLDVALARDSEEWEIGRAAPCRWLVLV